MKDLLVCLTVNGLANRLRFMASCKILADSLNREFVLYWKTPTREETVYGSDMDPDFDDLFDNDIPLFTLEKNQCTYQKNIDDIASITCGKVNGKLKYKNNKIVEIKNEDYVDYYRVSNTNLHHIKEFYDKKIIILEGDTIFYDSDVAEYNLKKTIFYQNLVPIKYIRDLLDEFLPTTTKFVGIHARIHNKKYDAIQDTKDEWFDDYQYEMIENVIKYYEEKDKITNEETKMILLSNNSDVLKHFSNKYSEKILIFNNTNFDRDNDGIIHALFEWYILANCKIIWGSRGSSYSNEATYLNRITKRFLVDFSKIEDLTKLSEDSTSCYSVVDKEYKNIKNPENSEKILAIIF